MIEMTVDSIRVSLKNYQRVVILKEKTAGRYLPIWIGPAEADAIAIKLQEMQAPRPLTHDLIASIIQALGAHITSIVVSDLNNDTFYAKIVLDQGGKKVEIDARPSDAIAIAVRVKVPIFAEDAVLEKAGIMLDKETGKPIDDVSPGGKRADKPLGADDIKKMSAFKDFIEGMDLSDLDKDKGK